MKCSEIIQKLEELSPVSFAESWDNVGLQVGRKQKDIRCICIALDPTEEVIEEAVRMEADMLLTHHPLIFSPLKSIQSGHFIGSRVLKLVQHDICYYAMHTNFDVMGMADAAADEIGLRERKVLKVTYEDDISAEGIGRYGRLVREMTLEECAEYVKQVFLLDSVLVYGEAETVVETAAILPGSGGGDTAYAVIAGVDVLITGDIKHHEALDAMAQGLCLIDAGHFGLEKIFITYMGEYLQREVPEVTVGTVNAKAPFWVLR